jgi:hypothetical protein
LGNLPSAILCTWPYHVSWFCSTLLTVWQLFRNQQQPERPTRENYRRFFGKEFPFSYTLLFNSLGYVVHNKVTCLPVTTRD